MIQTMTVGNQLQSVIACKTIYSNVNMQNCQKWLQCLSDFSSWNTVESYTCNMHGDARIEGYHYCMPLAILLALNYSSFILTVGIIGVDSHARDMYGSSHY